MQTGGREFCTMGCSSVSGLGATFQRSRLAGKSQRCSGVVCRIPAQRWVPSRTSVRRFPSDSSFVLRAKRQNRNNQSPPSSTEVSEDSNSVGSFKTGIGSGIKLEKIAVTFRNQQVLKDCTWEVKKGERVGLVGVNGAGKTTQLQVVTGAISPDSGNVVKSKLNMKISYLFQEFDVCPSRTVREEFASVYEDQLKVVRRQEAIQKEIEECTEDMDRMAELLDELADLTSKTVDLDVKVLDKKIDKMMPELGFSKEDNDRLVASYSGGWQMRMCLGKILLQDPDLLLLDEPTNHLDLQAIEWLEGYLKRQEVPMVIVSHDREFLDQLCTKIVETERGVTTTYKGNYTQYIQQKSERIAQQWAAWEKQLKEIQRQIDMIQRLSGGAQSGRAEAAKKALDKLRSGGNFVEKPFTPKKRSFRFPDVEKIGKTVLTIEDLTHGYGDRRLFDHVDLIVEKGERVAVIGSNGCGKSTLLRLIMGIEKAISGSVSMGEYNIHANYFQQNQAEALDAHETVLSTLVRAAPDARLDTIKALLGRMMFSGKAMGKKVTVLSGGEKARLAMAKFMLTKGTFLVLDEPTNHLDIPSKEMLEEAIKNFEGSVIAVSHDRYFLKQVATRVLEVDGGKLKDYKWGYDYFLEQNDEERKKMEEKEARKKEINNKNVKAKSKMSKAEKKKQKKDKAKKFNQSATPKKQGKAVKNSKRWSK
ncbi:hypothetical protein BSKO_12094 [Bryopsis sp. KO-2023]|nr:hypothetical protein BSKO_12094 [Bryopsis sp. KO-2023]